MEASCFCKHRCDIMKRSINAEALATSQDWKTTTNLHETSVEASYLYTHRSDIMKQASTAAWRRTEDDAGRWG